MNYQGEELELFQHATNWKEYFSRYLHPYLKGTVLEVGAGIGATTPFLCQGRQKKWVCMEPDAELFRELQKKIERKTFPSCCWAAKGTLNNLTPEDQFTGIAYIDVIEHIEDDRRELKKAASH